MAPTQSMRNDGKELSESDEEIIMSVLLDLGITERPDIARDHHVSPDFQDSASQRRSAAYSEASEDWINLVRLSIISCKGHGQNNHLTLPSSLHFFSYPRQLLFDTLGLCHDNFCFSH
jgi:hypothetical protein